VVRYLVLEAGANVFHQDKDGWSALHNACSQGGLAMVQLLLDHDSNVNLQSAMNHTPLSKYHPSTRSRLIHIPVSH
jgi:ankyrin repeat protein